MKKKNSTKYSLLTMHFIYLFCLFCLFMDLFSLIYLWEIKVHRWSVPETERKKKHSNKNWHLQPLWLQERLKQCSANCTLCPDSSTVTPVNQTARYAFKGLHFSVGGVLHSQIQTMFFFLPFDLSNSSTKKNKPNKLVCLKKKAFLWNKKNISLGVKKNTL